MKWFVAVATLAAAALALVGTTADAGAATTYPTDSGIDFHPLQLDQLPVQAGELTVPNCSDTYGEGKGSCESSNTGSDPPLGGQWELDWWQCGSAPFTVPGCQPGWLAIRIKTSPSGGNARIDAFSKGRNLGELYVLDAKVPEWPALSPITTPDPYTAGPGKAGGPLYLNVHNQRGDIYDIHVSGYLLYKKMLQSFDLRGWLHYRSNTQPGLLHQFQAKLDVLDTPSAPKCNNPYQVGAGGCYGTFTDDSTAPFRGAGGSIHWNDSGAPTRFPTELIAPSGSRFGGVFKVKTDTYVNGFDVNGGMVPEWHIEPDSSFGSPGVQAPGSRDGPLVLVRKRACCQFSATSHRTRITEAKIRPNRRKATFAFESRSGFGVPHFRCRLDERRFKGCDSPRSYQHLSDGRHVFKVRAKGAEGSTDPKPAKKVFHI